MKIKRYLAVLLCLLILLALTGCDSGDYKKAAGLMEAGSWEEAKAIFLELGDYEDAAQKVTECDYAIAAAAMEAGELDKAIELFEALGDYEDSAEKRNECRYAKAAALLSDGHAEDAEKIFEDLGDYGDAADQVMECRYVRAGELYAEGNLEDAEALYTELGDYRDSADKLAACKYDAACALYDAGDYEGALAAFVELGDYEDSDHYCVLSMLQRDPSGFIDLMAAGTNAVLAQEGFPLQLTEASHGKNSDQRNYLVDDVYDVRGVSVSFTHTTSEYVTRAEGQINHISLVADAYVPEALEDVAAEYFTVAGALMTTLVDGTDQPAFITMLGEKMTEAAQNVAEGENSAHSIFDYEGYSCVVAVTDFGEGITRLLFSITVPELVTD